MYRFYGSDAAAKLKADATALYKKREFGEALRLYQEGQAVNPDPSDISFLLNQAAVHFETGDIAACIKVWLYPSHGYFCLCALVVSSNLWCYVLPLCGVVHHCRCVRTRSRLAVTTAPHSP